MSAILSFPAELLIQIARGLDDPKDVASLRRTSRIFTCPDIKKWMYYAAVEYSGGRGREQLTKYVLATIFTKRLQAFQILSPYLMRPNTNVRGHTLEFFVRDVHEDLKTELRRQNRFMGVFHIMARYSPEVLTMLDWFLGLRRFRPCTKPPRQSLFDAAAIGNIQLHEVLMKYSDVNDDLLTNSLVQAMSANKFEFVLHLMTRYPARFRDILQSELREPNLRNDSNIWKVAQERSDDMRILQALLDCYRPGDDVLSSIFGGATLVRYNKPITYLLKNGLRPSLQCISEILRHADFVAELMPVLKELDTTTVRRFYDAAKGCPDESRYVLMMMHPYLDNMHLAWSQSVLDTIYGVYWKYEPSEEEVMQRISKTPKLLQLRSRIISVDNLAMAARAGHIKVVQMAFPLRFDGSNRRTVSHHKTKILVSAILGAKENRNATLYVQYLLEAGVDVNQLSGEKTPLEQALEAGLPDILKLLFDHGARMRLGSTDAGANLPLAADLLERAIRAGNMECARILLDNGARSDRSQSDSGIMYALLSGKGEEELLMKKIEFAMLLLKTHPHMVHEELYDKRKERRKGFIVPRMATLVRYLFQDNILIMALVGVWLSGASDVHLSDFHGDRLQWHPALQLLWDVLFTYKANANAMTRTPRMLPRQVIIHATYYFRISSWDALHNSLAVASSEAERRAIALGWLTKRLPKRIVSADLAEDDSVPKIQ
ncbi:protein transport protein S31 [Ascosphaera pollenicola]|nr:protein transport protein S31 [Ascosphaera pollenicola]